MHLEIVTPDSKLFEGEVRLMQLPGASGSFEILRNHASIISILNEGVIRVISNEGEETTFEIGAGIVECTENKVIILAENR